MKSRNMDPKESVLLRVLPVVLLIAFLQGCRQTQLPEYRTIREVRSLSLKEAERGYPVRLQGAVTYYSKPNRCMYIQEGERGLLVQLKEILQPVEPGDIVELSGVTSDGDVSPFVVCDQFEVTGKGELPCPQQLEGVLRSDGGNNGNWAEVEGVVRQQRTEYQGMVLDVSTRVGEVQTIIGTGADFNRALAGSKIRMQGVSRYFVGANEKLSKVQLLVPTINNLKVENPPESNPYELPTLEVRDALASWSTDPLENRIHVRARVVDQPSESTVLIGEPSETIKVEIAGIASLNRGDWIDVVGFPSRRDGEPVLEDSILKGIYEEATATSMREGSWSKLTMTPRPKDLPLLTTVKAIRSMSMAEADWNCPVRLHAVVTHFNRPYFACFVQDETGGIWVNPSTLPDLEVGQLVELEGETTGGFAQNIIHPRVKVIGTAPLPAPLDAPIDRITSGVEDSKWVELSGVVHSVSFGDATSSLSVYAGPFHFFAIVPSSGDRSSLDGLVDSRVSIRGVCGADFNNLDQLGNIKLYVPDMKFVSVVEPATGDPFSIESIPIRALLQFIPGIKPGHRIKVHGVVTLRNGSSKFWVKDSTRGTVVETSEPVSVAPGDQVDVVGFATSGSPSPRIVDAVVRKTGTGLIPEAVPITGEDILSGMYDSELVQLEAYLVDTGMNGTSRVLRLQAGRLRFDARLPVDRESSVVSNIRKGSLLQVTGVCSVEAGTGNEASAYSINTQSFQLFLRGPGDINIIEKATWWTPERMLFLSGGLLIAVVLALAWITLLKRQVRAALSKVKVLSGMLPICASCKNVRDDKGYWSQIETYINQHSDTMISHSICPDCMKKLYPDISLEETIDSK